MRWLERTPVALTPTRALNLKLLPADWQVGPSKVPEWLAGTAFDPRPSPDARMAYDIWLGRAGSAYLGIGVTGTYEALQPIITNYSRDAIQVFFPAPDVLAVGAKHKDRGLLLMVFDHDGLARAATHAAGSPSKMPVKSLLQDTALLYAVDPHQ